MSRFLYCETGVGGHRSDHLKAVLEASEDQSRWVVAAHSDLIDQLGDEAGGRLKAGSGATWVPLGDGQREETLTGWRLWALARGLAQSNGCDRVFLPHLDPIIPATVFVSQSSDISVSGTYFRPPIHYVGMLSAVETTKLALKLALFRRFAKRSDVQAILSLDRFFADSVTASPQVKSKIQFLPDLVPVSADQISAAKSAANGPGNGRTRFLLFGALFRRKGLFETLKAIELLTADVASACEVRFCGQMPDESADARSTITDLLSRSTADVSLVDRFLSTEELAIEVASADVILAPYVNHKGSSGTLYWAAAFGKPVIAQDYGLVGKEVREFDLGLTVEVGKPQAIAQAIERFVRGQAPGRNPDRIRKFYHGHTRAEFGRRIEQAMIGH